MKSANSIKISCDPINSNCGLSPGESRLTSKEATSMKPKSFSIDSILETNTVLEPYEESSNPGSEYCSSPGGEGYEDETIEIESTSSTEDRTKYIPDNDDEEDQDHQFRQFRNQLANGESNIGNCRVSAFEKNAMHLLTQQRGCTSEAIASVLRPFPLYSNWSSTVSPGKVLNCLM